MCNVTHYIVVPNVSSDQKKRIEKLLRKVYNLKEFVKTGAITTATLDDHHFCFYHSIHVPSNTFKGFCFKILKADFCSAFFYPGMLLAIKGGLKFVLLLAKGVTTLEWFGRRCKRPEVPDKERITTMAHITALAAALTFSATFSVEVDDGVIDWEASMPGIQAKVEEMAQASRDDRDDVLAVLNRNSGDFIQEQILVSEVLKLRERRENVSRKNRDDDAPYFEFSLQEMSAHSARLDKFLTANKPEKDNDDGKSLLLSQRGRSGGIQTRRNAETIAAKRKKLA